MTLPRVADSLAGRMSIVRLLPLARAEVRGVRPSFLERAFASEPPNVTTPIVGDDLVETVLAEHSGQLVNYTGLGGPVGMNHVTTRRYMGVFENLFLVHALSPWHTSALKRLAKSPKLHFLDAGLLAALRNLSPDRLRRDRTPFGPLLETFVFGELLKLARWSSDRYTFSHFRDKERNEVDIVIEAGDGRIVGIEVKASADGLGQGLLRPETARRRVRGSLRARHGAVRP